MNRLRLSGLVSGPPVTPRAGRVVGERAHAARRAALCGR